MRISSLATPHGRQKAVTPHSPIFPLFLYIIHLCKHTPTFVVTIFFRFVVDRPIDWQPGSGFAFVRSQLDVSSYQVWPRLVSLVFRLMVGESLVLIQAEGSVSHWGGRLAILPCRIWGHFAQRCKESHRKKGVWLNRESLQVSSTLFTYVDSLLTLMSQEFTRSNLRWCCIVFLLAQAAKHAIFLDLLAHGLFSPSLGDRTALPQLRSQLAHSLVILSLPCLASFPVGPRLSEGWHARISSLATPHGKQKAVTPHSAIFLCSYIIHLCKHTPTFVVTIFCRFADRIGDWQPGYGLCLGRAFVWSELDVSSYRIWFGPDLSR